MQHLRYLKQLYNYGPWKLTMGLGKVILQVNSYVMGFSRLWSLVLLPHYNILIDLLIYEF